ncbi:hypothetical protein [Zoogloea sp.]|uniref:hypothetical protein n=1 Tax=Zoogloea sp. TaxID=49181 RepID=UPI0035B01962
MHKRVVNKTLNFALVIFGSVWFMPISFFVGTRVGLELVCVQAGCSHTMDHGDPPHSSFTVLIDRGQGEHPDAVLLSDIQDFFAKHPEATLLMPNRAGATADLAWEYHAESQSPGRQLVRVEYFDSSRMTFTYLASTQTLQPLKSEVVNVGHMMVGMPLGLLSAELVRVATMRVRRRAEALGSGGKPKAR